MSHQCKACGRSATDRAVANSPPPCADVGDDVTFMIDKGMGMMKGDEIVHSAELMTYVKAAEALYGEDLNPHVVAANLGPEAKRKVASMEWPPFGKALNPAAVKHDVGKPIFDLLPFDALAEVSRVLEHGADTYGVRNWEKGFKWLRLANAAARHLFAWMRGENRDAETGYSHVAHLACCALFLLAHELRGVGVDDRR